MSEIALYNILKKIDGTTDEEIEKAVAEVASAKEAAAEVGRIKATTATKSDLETGLAELKAEMYKLHMRTIMWLIAVGLGVVGLIKYL